MKKRKEIPLTLIEKRKELNKFTEEQLRKKSRDQLREICWEYELKYGGSKGTLIDTILGATKKDEEYISRKRNREIRQDEIKKLKKQKIVQDEFIYFNKQLIPRHIIVHILHFLPLNFELLNGVGMVNEDFYLMVRSGCVWHTMTFTAEQLDFIPVPMFRQCSRLVPLYEFSTKQLKYVSQNLEKISYIDLTHMQDLNKKKIQTLFLNKKINKNIKFLNLSNLDELVRDDIIEFIVDHVGSEEMQVLKFFSHKNHTFKSEILKKIAMRYPKLQWIDWPFILNEQDDFVPILQRCMLLKGLAIHPTTVYCFEKFRQLNFEYLSIHAAWDASFDFAKILNLLIEKCKNLKVFSIFVTIHSTSQLRQMEKLESVEDLRIQCEHDDVLNALLLHFPPNVSRLQIFYEILSLSSLPSVKLPQIRQLDVHFKTSINADVFNKFLSIFPNLEVLKLSGYKLHCIDPNVFQTFKNLKSLFVDIRIADSKLEQQWEDLIASSQTITHLTVNWKLKMDKHYTIFYSLPPLVTIPMESFYSVA